MLRDTRATSIKEMSLKIKNGISTCVDHGASSSSSPSPSSSLCDPRSESFRTVEAGVPTRSSLTTEEKLSWLRSQMVGDAIEFDSPFGKRRLTYADHTASGRSLHYIENFIIQNVLPFYGNTHTSDSYAGHRTTRTLKEAIQYIKKCLGGGPNDAIIFCGSGSTSAIKRLQEVMGIVVASTMRDMVLNKCLSNEERWVVFVGPYEHHSNLLSWRQSLAEVVEVKLDGKGLIDMQDLKHRLECYKNSNRPILASFSACSNVTGICSDTRGIAQLVHKYGGFACFDFAASAPYVEIDMRSGELDGYDAIFLSPHKFLGGPGSPGILLMSNALYQLGPSPPTTCGGGTVNYVNAFDEKETLYLDEIEERENGGTPPITQTIRAALAFWVKEYIGFKEIEKYEEKYIGRAIKRLLPNKNILVLGNTSAKRQAILSFVVYSTTNFCDDKGNNSNKISSGDGKYDGAFNMWGETGNERDKPLHGPFVAVLLNDLFGIQARGGCACAGPYGHFLLHIDHPSSLAIRSLIKMGYGGIKPGWTRLSFPYYMSNEEFEFILAALEFVAVYGQRFLPLYKFNWKTGSWTLKKDALNDLVRTKLNKCKGQGSLSSSFLGTKECYSTIVDKYTSYLELAKHVANLLPKFPPNRRVPQDLDANLIHFRV